MSDRGVPADALLADDFVQVRAELVRVLGGANEAIVWERIRYRTQHVAFAHEHGGRTWWEVTMSALGDEIGLSMDQVKRTVRGLLDAGFLLGEQHSLPRQTYSYSPVILQSAESHIERVSGGDIADSKVRNRPLQSAESHIAPLYEEVEEGSSISGGEGFAEFYMAYPRKVGKEAARKAWDRARRRTPAAVIIAGAKRYAADPNLPEKSFVPHPATWLGRGGWEDEAEPERKREADPATYAPGEEYLAR